MKKQAMQILDSAFNTLSSVMISANDAEKMAKVKGELRQAYAILERLDPHEALGPSRRRTSPQSRPRKLPRQKAR